MAWYNSNGKSPDTVISSRIRLARNLNGYPFPSILEASASNEIIEKVNAVLDPKGFRKINFSDLSPLMATSYVERHYVSPAFANKETPHALMLQEQSGTAVMICEEDHLRIQCILPGLSLNEAYQKACETERALDQEMDFSYDATLGYMTQCPTNLGTGLRVSVMMFLPALSETGSMDALAVQLSKIGLTIRGIFGEGSGSVGCMYQISNQVSLGVTEQEILQGMEEAVQQISERERKARKSNDGDVLDRLTDRILRSAGILRSAYMMSASEYVRLFADVRLGISMGLIRDISYEQLGNLLIEVMPATLTLSSENTPRTENARDKLRAQKIQSVLHVK
ncbi:MAG: ATP--guanido phosphotransferase [Clostridia bacterium]|nr:ATP--guanido phosphotransferase [Clostridia bacterium]